VAEPAATEPRWGIDNLAELSWRLWDDGLVTYDARSDRISRFDPITAEVFEELRTAPQRPRDLVLALAERLGVVADDELKDMVAEILRILGAENIAVPIG